MTRIWFNHWFSTAYNIMNMIKKAIPDTCIIGTNEKEYSVLSVMCEEWYQEPVLKSEEYVKYCLDFCKEHAIDIFLPRREMIAISKNKMLFEDLGVKVMVDDYEIVSILNQKDQAYRYLLAKGIRTIPDYYVVTVINDFERAYMNLKRKYREVCFKFVHDEGGKSFRVIDNRRKGYAELFRKQNTRMTYDMVMEALSEKEVFSPIMIMPYLSGEEISVDCLQTAQGLIMLPRIKDATRIERLCFDEDILKITKEVYDSVNLQWPCNIQFKYLDGVPYFLEVNTRMSGGVQMACVAANVNIPAIAVNKLLGKEIDWEICREERRISHIELPIII